MRKTFKKEMGITLIALVITIIVLLILAGVSIAALTGQNGIITQATDAEENTKKETAREKVAVEVLGSYGRDGNLDYGLLEDNLNNIEGIQEVPSPINNLPIDVIVDGYTVTIKSTGEVTVGESITTGKTDGSYDVAEGVNTPKLSSNMQLVVYDNGNWVEDETKSAYQYREQEGTTENRGTSEWANAKVTKNGVESYFVWIPRYAYKIDSTNYTIDVKFIQGTGTLAADGITECKYASDPTLDTNTDYIIHPAFTTDENYGGGWENELPGLWIGKYEASRSDAGTTASNPGTSTTIQIKPGVTGWRTATIGEMYNYALSYAPEFKSHMLKNSEWGAVAYLTHSQYGRNTTEIAINNSNEFVTGSSSGGNANASTSNPVYAYNDIENGGPLASSTGNVYGIYDLSGGASEYVSSYYREGTTLSNGVLFTDGTSDEYSTVYDGTSVDTDYKTGDATKETEGWNSDFATFLSSDLPFAVRGGDRVSTFYSGVFYFNTRDGGSFSYCGFRISLAV